MRVSDVMHTPAATCSHSTTLRDVAAVMEDRNVGCVVVVDEVGEVAGVVTDRDIVVRGVLAGRSADIAVREVMTRDVATVSPRVDVVEASTLMMKHGIRRLPVVDEHGVLHGVVALDDVVRNLAAETMRVTQLLVEQASHVPVGS